MHVVMLWSRKSFYQLAQNALKFTDSSLNLKTLWIWASALLPIDCILKAPHSKTRSFSSAMCRR